MLVMEEYPRYYKRIEKTHELRPSCLLYRMAAGSTHQNHPPRRRRHHKDRERLEEIKHAGTLSGWTTFPGSCSVTQISSSYCFTAVKNRLPYPQRNEDVFNSSAFLISGDRWYFGGSGSEASICLQHRQLLHVHPLTQSIR